MNERCHRPTHQNFSNYGGRGIFVCPEWRNDFAAFFAHVGARPSSKHSLDRIENDKGYEPGNVRWATRREQMNNTRATRFIEIDGERHSLTEWGELKGIHQSTFSHRLARGMSEKEAILTPAREGGRRIKKGLSQKSNLARTA
jgi:hypothetical protein